MSPSVSIIRRIANWLVLGMLKSARGSRRDWALGMSAEVDAIEGDWAALWFALGCSAALFRAGPLQTVCRQALALFVLGWAFAKVYLVIWSAQYLSDGALLTDQGLVPVTAAVAGLAYGLSAVCLWCERYSWLVIGLGAAWLTNMVLFFSWLVGHSSSEFWVIALMGEDLLFWTLIIIGVEFNFFFGRWTRAEAG